MVAFWVKVKVRYGRVTVWKGNGVGACVYFSMSLLQLHVTIPDLLLSYIHRCSSSRNVYVVHKAWICAIHGLRCAKHESMLYTTIHGLPAQSMDCSV